VDGVRTVGAVGIRGLPDVSRFAEDLKSDLKKIEEHYKKNPVEIAATLSGSLKDDAKEEAAEASGETVHFDVDLDEERAKVAARQLAEELDMIASRYDIDYKVTLDQANAVLRLEELRKELSDFGPDLDSVDASELERVLDELQYQIDAVDSRLETTFGKHLSEYIRNAVNGAVADASDSLGNIDLSRLKRRLAEVSEYTINYANNNASLSAALAEAEARKKMASAEPIKWSYKYDPSSLASTERALKAVQQRLTQNNEITIHTTLSRADLLKQQILLRGHILQLKAVAAANPIKTQLSMDKQSQAGLVTSWQQLVGQMALKAGKTLSQSLFRVSGGRALFDQWKQFKEFAGNLDINAPKYGAVATGIAGIGTAAFAAAGSLIVLAGDLAKVSGLLLAAPAFIGAAVVSGVALSAAFKDIGTVLEDLGPRFTALQDSMSAAFWAKAEQPFRSLAENALPELDRGLSDVSDSYGDFFAVLAGSISANVVPRMAGMFDNLTEGIRNSTGAAGVLGDAIGILGEVGATYLPRFGQWISDVAAKFDDWLNRANDNGKLFEWIDNGITTLGLVGSVAGSAFDILSTLYAMLSNHVQMPGLEALDRTLSNLSDRMKSPEFVAGFTTVFDGISAGMSSIATGIDNVFSAIDPTMLASIFSNAGSTIGSLLDGIATVFQNPAFQGGIIAFFEGLASAAEKLQPVFEPLGEVIGAVGVYLGSFLEAMATALATTSDASSTFAETLLALAPVSAYLLEAIGNSLALLLPPISELITALLPVIQTLLVALADTLLQIMPSLSATLTEIMDPLGDALVQLIASLPELIPQWLDLAKASIELLDAVGPLLPPLLQLGTELLPMIADAAVGKFTPAVRLAAQILNDWMPVILDVMDFILNLLRAVNDFSAGNERAWEDVKNAYNAAVRAIEGAIDNVKSSLADAKRYIENAFDVDLSSAGRNIISSLWDGLLAKWRTVQEWISSLGEWIEKHKGPESYDKRLLKPNGMWIMQSLQDGLTVGFEPIKDQVSGFAGLIEDAFGYPNADGSSRTGWLANRGDLVVNNYPTYPATVSPNRDAQEFTHEVTKILVGGLG